MKVVVKENQMLDLGGSMLNEDGPTVADQVSVTAVGLFDSEERLVPLVSEYLTFAVRSANLAALSAETYGRNIGYMLEHLKGTPAFKSSSYDEILLAVTKHGIQRYYAHLREVDGLTSTTIRNRDACCMALFNDFLCVGGKHRGPLREDNPYAGGFLSPAPKKDLVYPCSLQELKALIESASSERERCLVQAIFDVGLRRSEVGRVTLGAVNKALGFAQANFVPDDELDWVHPDYCPLYIDGSKGRGNEFKPRYSIVSRAVLERIKRYHASPLYKKHARRYETADVTPCFFNSEGQPFNPDAISKLLERLSKRAVKSKRLERKVSSHKLRHGHAYAILTSPDFGDNYLDKLLMAQKSLGHSDTSTTGIYTKLPQDIFHLVCPNTGEVATKAKSMADLAVQTTLKIRLGDKK